MTGSTLSVELDRRNICTVMNVRGDLDRETVDRFRAQMSVLMADKEMGAKHLVVNCANCRYMDSEGLGVFIRARADMEARGHKLIVVLPPDHLGRQLFNMTNVNRVFELQPSLPRALRALETGDIQ